MSAVFRNNALILYKTDTSLRWTLCWFQSAALGKFYVLAFKVSYRLFWYPGTRFSKVPVTFRARKAVLCWPYFHSRWNFHVFWEWYNEVINERNKIVFQFAYFSFFLIHLELKKIDTFIRSLSFIENLPRLQTLYHFQTKTAQKPYPMGRHIPMAYIM